MKRKHFLFALLLFSFSFLSSTLSAQSQPSEKKYLWFTPQGIFNVSSNYGTEAEMRILFANQPEGFIARGYDPDRRGGPYDPFVELTWIPSLDRCSGKLFTYNGQLAGWAEFPNIYIHIVH